MLEGTSITVNFPAGNNWVYLYDESQVYVGGTQAQMTVPYTEFPVFIRQGSSPMGVDGATAFTFNMHPNPSDGAVSVTAMQPISGLSVRDALGREVTAAQDVRGTTATLHLGHLPAGIYTVRLTGEDGRMGVRRVVKE